MAITTYAELQSAIADFLNRDDLTSVIPTFVSLAEADMNRRLRHWKMSKRSAAEINSQYSVLPSDYLETIRFSIVGDKTTALDLISHNDLLDRKHDMTSGRPQYYAVTGEQLEFFPAPDETYNAELVYFAELETLSNENTGNWLLSDAPDVYLYGALAHSAPFLGEDARIQVWSALYEAALSGLNRASDTARYSGTGLRMKLRAY